MNEFKGLHATLTWEPYTYQSGDGTKRAGFRRSDGMGYVIPDDDRWWVCWAHPMLCGRPGWHHHAFGSYVNAMAGAMAFDMVYDLERIAGNVDRCPDLRTTSSPAEANSKGRE